MPSREWSQGDCVQYNSARNTKLGDSGEVGGVRDRIRPHLVVSGLMCLDGGGSARQDLTALLQVFVRTNNERQQG